MADEKPKFLTTALVKSGGRSLAMQESIQHRMRDAIQKLLRGEVQAAQISPTGDPYARIEVIFPFDYQTEKGRIPLEDALHGEAERIKATITPILNRHCRGMTLEWIPPSITGTEDRASATGHFMLYGDKSISSIATMEVMSKLLAEKQGVLRQEANTALGVLQI